MSKVLVCLSASDKWYGKAIRKITRSNVNHAFLAYTSGEWGGWWAVQVDERGVVKIPAERVEYSYVECYDFFKLDLASGMSRVRYLVGDKYDWDGVAGFLAKLYMWRVFGRRIVNPLHKKGELFCSEFMATYLQRCEGMYKEFMDMDPASVAPGGSPTFLGTASLQWDLQRNDWVKQVDCPWE